MNFQHLKNGMKNIDKSQEHEFTVWTSDTDFTKIKVREEDLTDSQKLLVVARLREKDYWKNKIQWIDSEHRLKLNLLPDYRLSDEEYRKTRSEIRELMELNMVMYGKW